VCVGDQVFVFRETDKQGRRVVICGTYVSVMCVCECWKRCVCVHVVSGTCADNDVGFAEVAVDEVLIVQHLHSGGHTFNLFLQARMISPG
jgi:hypothetical protein